MPRESIPEYSASLQPVAENTNKVVILNGLKVNLDLTIKYLNFQKLQVTRRLPRHLS